jgi:cytochrome c oxidase subunit 2
MLISSFAHALLSASSMLVLSTGTQEDGLLNSGFWHKLWLRAQPATELARSTDSMFMFLWWFCVFWFVFLMGLMVYFIVKYRRVPGKAAPQSPSHSTPLEITWTVVPTILLAGIFVVGFRDYMKKMTPAGNAMEIRLTGFKWSWKFEYPNGFVVDSGSSGARIGAEPVPVFYVPAETPIKLRMNSTDVMHSFWVPDFRIKQDLLPNRFTFMTFTAKAPGPDAARMPESIAQHDAKATFSDTTNPIRYKVLPPFIEQLKGVPYTDHWVFCAEYCGTSHSEMAAIIRVVPKEAYEQWLVLTQEKAESGSPVEVGQRVYRANCASCHSIDGSPNTGPTWLNWFGYEHMYADGRTYMADDNHMLMSIRYPAMHIRKGYANGMTPWSESMLSPKKVDALIAYMKSLSDKAPATTPDEATAAEAPKPTS